MTLTYNPNLYCLPLIQQTRTIVPNVFLSASTFLKPSPLKRAQVLCNICDQFFKFRFSLFVLIKEYVHTLNNMNSDKYNPVNRVR